MRGGGAEDERHALRRRGTSSRELGLWMDDRLDADRREHHRSGQLGAEHRGAQIADGDVPQHPRDDLPALERLQVGLHRALGAGAPGDVAVGRRAHALSGTLLQRGRGHGHSRSFIGQAAGVYLVLKVREYALLELGVGVAHRLDPSAAKRARSGELP